MACYFLQYKARKEHPNIILDDYGPDLQQIFVEQAGADCRHDYHAVLHFNATKVQPWRPVLLSRHGLEILLTRRYKQPGDLYFSFARGFHMGDVAFVLRPRRIRRPYQRRTPLTQKHNDEEAN